MAGTKKSVTCKSILTRSKTSWYCLSVTPEIANKFETDGKTRRVVCTLNNSYTFQCALMPNKGRFTIGVAKPIREKLGLNEGDTVSIRIEPDTSKYGAPMPEDFEEVLRQDDEGSRLFHALTAGMQRSLLYYIGNVKNIDRRIQLGLIVLEHLKQNGGKMVADQLQEDIKRPIF
jgi:bifunctional DNA-binding transcriptional regulator/antitoxin component of YhaV-PrlF toxin-antitoxin module